MAEEKKVTLWCTKCQRGVGGHKHAEILKPGDQCPWCAEKQEMLGQYADYSKVMLLRTTDDVADEDRKFAELAKHQAKVIRGQETHSDIRQKITAEFNERYKEQDAKIAELTAKLESVAASKANAASKQTKQ